MQAEFIPTGIVKLHGGLEETCWRYLLTWKRSAVGSAEASFGICTDGQMQNRIRDAERLEAKGKTTDLRALRISTVHEHWPRLAEAFEAKCMADAARRASNASKSP